MWATVGMHPNASNQELSIKNYADLLKELKVVAVGEIGLDYYRAGQSGKPFDELMAIPINQDGKFRRFYYRVIIKILKSGESGTLSNPQLIYGKNYI